MQGSYLGPEYTQKEIEEELIKWANLKFNDEDLIEKAARFSQWEAIGGFKVEWNLDQEH